MVLCTASDFSIANSISSYLGFFDEVIASDGLKNLEGKIKARILTARFGKKKFDYVGNSATDIHVWKCADKGIIVNANEKIVRKAESSANITLIFAKDYKNNFLLWMKALRLHQWLKNER